MTKTNALQQIKAMPGMTARSRDGEIRVNYRGGDEATAYYTDDAEDAVNTASMMQASTAK